jgi:hypothetical protein
MSNPADDPRNERSDERAPAGRISVTVVVIICSLFVFVLARSVEPMTSAHPAFRAGGDHMHYIAMAEEPGAAHRAPFCYRILVPTLARIMPFGLADSFYFLTVIFLVGTGTLLYWIVLDMTGERPLSLAAIAIFYSLSAGAKLCLYDFWLTEPALFFFSALAVLFLLRRHDIWLSLSLTAAVLVKESALFLLPLVYTMRAWEVVDRKGLMRALSVAVLPVAVFAVVRISIPSAGGAGPLELLRTVGAERLTAGLNGFIRGGTVGTWGVAILVLLLFSGARGRSLLLRALPFLMLVYAQPLFAGNLDRLLVLAFPVMIPVAAVGLGRLRLRFGLERWMTAGFALIPFILTALKDGYNSPSPEQQIAGLAVWTIVIILFRKRYSLSSTG